MPEADMSARLDSLSRGLLSNALRIDSARRIERPQSKVSSYLRLLGSASDILSVSRRSEALSEISVVVYLYRAHVDPSGLTGNSGPK